MEAYQFCLTGTYITHVLFINLIQKYNPKLLVYDKKFKKLHFIFISIYPYISVYV